jgi:hypothetical protein
MKKKIKKKMNWQKGNSDDIDHHHRPKHRQEKIKYKHTKFWIDQEDLDEELDLFKKGSEEE